MWLAAIAAGGGAYAVFDHLAQLADWVRTLR
jgi:hypothetical protein